MEEEIIEVELLPSWLCVDVKIFVVGKSSHRHCYGYVKKIFSGSNFPDGDCRCLCYIPGSGDSTLKLKHLEKHVRQGDF